MIANQFRQTSQRNYSWSKYLIYPSASKSFIFCMKIPRIQSMKTIHIMVTIFYRDLSYEMIYFFTRKSRTVWRTLCVRYDIMARQMIHQLFINNCSVLSKWITYHKSIPKFTCNTSMTNVTTLNRLFTMTLWHRNAFLIRCFLLGERCKVNEFFWQKFTNAVFDVFVFVSLNDRAAGDWNRHDAHVTSILLYFLSIPCGGVNGIWKIPCNVAWTFS